MEFTFHIVRDVAEMDEAYLLVKQLTPTLTHEQYTQHVNDMVKSGYFQVVVRNGEKKAIAVSGIWIATKIYSGKYLEMDNVVVDEEQRSFGIGTLLYEYCEKLAHEHGCKTIMLDAYRENTRAHDFYESKGFIKRGYHFIKTIA